jgi:hypothetical protein
MPPLLKTTNPPLGNNPNKPLFQNQITTRATFGDTDNNNPFNTGLHPAAIFGIVASVIFVIAITAWCVIFRTWKKMMTNRQYGVLPSLRIAANGVNPNGYPQQQQQGNYYPYGGGGQGGQGLGGGLSSPYYYPPGNGNDSMNNAAPYNPYGNGPSNNNGRSNSPPPYYAGEQGGGNAIGLQTQPPAPTHSRSPSTASSGDVRDKPLPPLINRG